MAAGPWHPVHVSVDMFMTEDGGERPGYAFDGPRCGEECGWYFNNCLLLTDYWPPEHPEVPGVGDYEVRYNADPDHDELEWRER